MTYRKGELTPRAIDREYPHQVEIEIPDGGLGMQLTAMHAFCRLHAPGYKTRGIGKLRIERGRDGMRWCFKTSGAAEEFAIAFGGTRLTVER